MKKEKIKDNELEKVPLLIIYKQGDTIIAEQPEEILDKLQFWGFLKLYTDNYGEWLMEECFQRD